MNTQQEVEGWLVRWASQNGGSVQLEPEGICAFSVDDMPVQLTLYAEDETLLMAAQAMDVDFAAHPSSAAALLRYAHLGESTQRCGLSLTGTGRPVVWHWLSTQALDAASLEAHLDGFLAALSRMRGDLEDLFSRHSEHPSSPPTDAVGSHWNALRG
jgi:hypothetical protein